MQHPRLDVHDVLEESSSPLNVGRLAECSHLLVYNILAILKESTHLKCPQRNHKSYKEACLLLTNGIKSKYHEYCAYLTVEAQRFFYQHVKLSKGVANNCLIVVHRDFQKWSLKTDMPI